MFDYENITLFHYEILNNSADSVIQQIEDK